MTEEKKTLLRMKSLVTLLVTLDIPHEMKQEPVPVSH